MNVEEIVKEVMENEFRSWQPSGNGYWVSRRLDSIQEYRVEASRYAFASTVEFENVPDLIKPETYKIEDVSFGNHQITVTVRHLYHWHREEGVDPHVMWVDTEILIMVFGHDREEL
jgi:hypothetical protein